MLKIHKEQGENNMTTTSIQQVIQKLINKIQEKIDRTIYILESSFGYVFKELT